MHAHALGVYFQPRWSDKWIRGLYLQLCMREGESVMGISTHIISSLIFRCIKFDLKQPFVSLFFFFGTACLTRYRAAKQIQQGTVKMLTFQSTLRFHPESLSGLRSEMMNAVKPA